MPGRWVRGEGKKCDQGGPPGKQLVGCLRHFAFSKFRIFRMFFWVSYAIRKWPQFREIIRNFSCHFSMQIYTKFRVFREILWLFIPIFQRFITDDIFYTQQPSSSLSCILALHNRISLGHLPANWGSNPISIIRCTLFNTAGGLTVVKYKMSQNMHLYMYSRRRKINILILSS